MDRWMEVTISLQPCFMQYCKIFQIILLQKSHRCKCFLCLNVDTNGSASSISLNVVLYWGWIPINLLSVALVQLIQIRSLSISDASRMSSSVIALVLYVLTCRCNSHPLTSWHSLLLLILAVTWWLRRSETDEIPDSTLTASAKSLHSTILLK